MGLDRPEALYLGWFMIVGGAAITLLRHRLARSLRDRHSVGTERRTGGALSEVNFQMRADLAIGSAILAAIGVLLMLGGLLLIADAPIRSMLGLT